MRRRLLFVVNSANFFLSHRLQLAVAVRESGYDVHVATAAGNGVESITAQGFVHHVIPLSRSGKNLWAEALSILALRRLFKRLKPDIVHLVTIKPVLYGGIAARLAKVPSVVAAVSGLGFVFIASDLKSRLLRAMIVALYRVALAHRNLRVIFQNPDDMQTLVQRRVIARECAVLIRGSGVDLQQYACVREPEGVVPRVVMASRLLWDKGIGEFVTAAQLLRERGVQARCLLAGSPDPGNPASVNEADLASWRCEGFVELLGQCNDVPELFAASNLVVLPSYREGLPKVLVEAAACGRTVITTDVPGCRDAIDPGVSGLLVPARDAERLVGAIARLLRDPTQRASMGRAGRELAEREFSIDHIITQHLDVYADLGANT